MIGKVIVYGWLVGCTATVVILMEHNKPMQPTEIGPPLQPVPTVTIPTPLPIPTITTLPVPFTPPANEWCPENDCGTIDIPDLNGEVPPPAKFVPLHPGEELV
jgi:hypothetical protein